MKFLNWLRGFAPSKPSEHTTSLGTRDFRPIPKWTHAGKKGKDIYCPKCASATHVYNFGWAELLCGNCKEFVGKEEWLMLLRDDIDHLLER